MKRPTEAEILQAAAVAVAAPRYMGAFASAVGIDLIAHWPGFDAWEIWSGAAMALLEGWAIAFIFSRWRRMEVGTLHWKVLLGLQMVLLVALPATVTPYLISSQLGQPVHSSIPLFWLWFWSFSVAAVAPLVVAAVGYADTEETANSELNRLKEEVKKLQSELTVSEERFKAAGDLVANLFSPVKSERILVIKKQWPQLKPSAIALMAETTPSHVTNVLKEIEVE